MNLRKMCLIIFVISLFFTLQVLPQDINTAGLERKLADMEVKLQQKEHHLRSIEIPEIDIDLSGLEMSMQQLEHSLSHLEHIYIPQIEVDIPDIPEIHVDIPDFDFDFDFANDGFFYYNNYQSQNLFNDLSEEEELKLYAIRSLGRQPADKALSELKKVINEEENPAYRYEAVRQLRRFLDQNDVMEVLYEVAKNDANVEVRKKAIYVLGKSDSPKAVAYLKEIAER